MRVLVTGSSGCLGTVLVPALCADPAIDSVTGVDIRPTRFAHAKFHALQSGIGDLHDAHFRGHDALVHLAYVVLRGRMAEAAMHRINVLESANVLRQAADRGIRRSIALSSAAVYGSGINLDERAPYAPLHGFSYGQHKAQLDRLIDAELPHCLRLRPHVILGKHAQPLLRFLLRLPFYPALPFPEPKLQCVHEDDVVNAIRLALEKPLFGALNLAAAETFSFAQLIRSAHRRAMPVPLAWGEALLRGCWRVAGIGGEPGWVHGLCHPLTLDCARARRELGWTPRYSAFEAVSAALA